MLLWQTIGLGAGLSTAQIFCNNTHTFYQQSPEVYKPVLQPASYFWTLANRINRFDILKDLKSLPKGVPGVPETKLRDCYFECVTPKTMHLHKLQRSRIELSSLFPDHQGLIVCKQCLHLAKSFSLVICIFLEDLKTNTLVSLLSIYSISSNFNNHRKLFSGLRNILCM